MCLSAENRFPGVVTQVQNNCVSAVVTIDVNGTPITASITNGSVQNLELTRGTQVVAVVNDFFGHLITVSGLVTGQDIIAQLGTREKLGERVIIPANMLRHGEGVFLDDVTLEQLSDALKRPVQVSETDGYSLADTIFSKEEDTL